MNANEGARHSYGNNMNYPFNRKSLFEKSFDPVSHQVNGSNVHHSLSGLSRAFIV